MAPEDPSTLRGLLDIKMRMDRGGGPHTVTNGVTEMDIGNSWSLGTRTLSLRGIMVVCATLYFLRRAAYSMYCKLMVSPPVAVISGSGDESPSNPVVRRIITRLRLAAFTEHRWVKGNRATACTVNRRLRIPVLAAASPGYAAHAEADSPSRLTLRPGHASPISRTALWVLMIATAACANACAPDGPASSGRGEALLRTLTDPGHTDEAAAGLCETGQGSVQARAAFHLARLGFSCSERAVQVTASDSATLWVLERQDVVSWRTGTSGQQVVSVALFYDDAIPPEDTQHHRGLAPMAAALAELERMLHPDSTFSGNIIVTIAPAHPTEERRPVPGVFGQPQRPVQFTIRSTPPNNDVQPSPVSIGRRPGWIIGLVSPPSDVSAAQASRDAVRPRFDERSGDNRSANPVGSPLLELPSTHGQFALQAEYWQERNDSVLRSMAELGDIFSADFRAVATSSRTSRLLSSGWQQLCQRTCTDKWIFWVGGILGPLLILLPVIKVVMAEAATVIEELERDIRRCEQLRTRRERERTQLSKVRKRLRGHLADIQSARSGDLWNIFAEWKFRLDTKRVDYVTTRIAHVDKRFKEVDDQLASLTMEYEQLSALASQWTHYKRQATERLAALVRDIWTHVSEMLREKGALLALGIGLLTCIVAFYWALDIETTGEAEPQRILSVVSMTFLFGAAVAVRRLESFAVGAALLCLIGLDTIELSPMHDPSAGDSGLGQLYDSQTVTLMFACVALLLSVEASINSAVRRRNTMGPLVTTKHKRTITEYQQAGLKREKDWIVVLAVWYLVLVYHTVCKALWTIVAGTGQPGMVAVTMVTMVTLLVPVVVLLRSTTGSGPIQPEDPKEWWWRGGGGEWDVERKLRGETS